MSNIEKMENKTLVEKTSERIIKIIRDNGYGARMKLPNEYELSAQLEVSRNTVREAIRALVSRNILEIRRGAGTFISEKMGVAEDPLGFSLVRDKHKLASDLMQIRLMIEPQIASLAAQNAEPDDIERLGRLCDEVEESILSGGNYLQKDIEFHTQIANCSKNVVVPNLMPIINDALTVFANITNKREGDKTIKTHRNIFEAIKNHRSNDAQEAMLIHLIYNRNRLNDD